VLALAQGIDLLSKYDRLPILADALEEAGCDSSEILDHCRTCDHTSYGCWVIDLVFERAVAKPAPQLDPLLTAMLQAVERRSVVTWSTDPTRNRSEMAPLFRSAFLLIALAAGVVWGMGWLPRGSAGASNPDHDSVPTTIPGLTHLWPTLEYEEAFRKFHQNHGDGTRLSATLPSSRPPTTSVTP
jgi:hypothetical protein